uniref:Uncharacterized protein n=1 Tax=Arundo donax TaxID=35708 RepID=A0A0A8ZUH1_ARUDO
MLSYRRKPKTCTSLKKVENSTTFQ